MYSGGCYGEWCLRIWKRARIRQGCWLYAGGARSCGAVQAGLGMAHVVPIFDFGHGAGFWGVWE